MPLNRIVVEIHNTMGKNICRVVDILIYRPPRNNVTQFYNELICPLFGFLVIISVVIVWVVFI